MILFGRKANHLGLTTTKNIACKKCGKKDLVVSVFQKYFHMFWLPMFPIKKDCASQCLQCQKVLTEKRFSSSLKDIALQLKKNHKTPIWTFSGILLGLLILLIKSFF
ncbi:MAG: phage FluMu protein Com [Saprospiraceae bacterium]|jgi:phage FluMu protein Com